MRLSQTVLTKIVCGVVAASSGLLSTAAMGASGRLLDQDGLPVVDAWVVARRTECNGFAHCNTTCAEVKVAKTDAQGKFAFFS
jgi:hypothetical protein